MKLIRNRLFVQPSASKIRGMIAIPDTVAAATNMCRVLIKSDDIKGIAVGDILLCQKGFADRNSLTIDESFFCRLEHVVAKFVNGQIHPIGKRILLRRDMEEVVQGSIIIPENRRYQSLRATVLRFGITRQRFKVNDLNINDTVHLKEWDENMVEVSLEDGSYGLIVTEESLLYKEIKQ